MAETALSYEIVTPEKKLTAGNAHMVVVPGSEGEFGVLEGHAPFMSTIKTGVLRIFASPKAQDAQQVFIDGGFAHVSPTGLEVLAEYAVALKDVDKKELEQELSGLRIQLKAVEGQEISSEIALLQTREKRLQALSEAL